jgi:hypothetical protein
MRLEGANQSVEEDSTRTALKLGNASGAKDRNFWCSFEDGEVMVIGDER